MNDLSKCGRPNAEDAQASASGNSTPAPGPPQMQPLDFMRMVWPTQGFYCTGTPNTYPGAKGFRHKVHDTIEEAVSYAHSRGHVEDQYFAVLSLRERFLIDERKKAKAIAEGWKDQSGKVIRVKENMAWARAFFMDIDVKADREDAYPSQKAAFEALKEFIATCGVPRPWLVSSGYGLHCYWPLTEDVPAERWQPVATKLKQLCNYHSFKADPSRTSDVSSVLRVPGTSNLKVPDDPRKVCVVKQGGPASAFDLIDGLLTKACQLLPTGERLTPPVYTRGPPASDEMEAMLRALTSKGYFSGRNGIVTDPTGHIVKIGWMEAGAALKLAYGDKSGQELWALTHQDDRARADAPLQWPSFASEPAAGQVTIATIIRAATDAGIAVGDLVERSTREAGDVLNGRRFAGAHCGKLLYIPETGGWLRFDPASGWISAEHGHEMRAAKEVLAMMRDEAAQRWRVAQDDPAKKLLRHVERTSQAPQLRAMIDMAKSEPGMFAPVSDFDADPMLLGVQNGVLDLRTNTLLTVSPELRVSKRCCAAFDPLARCPRFDRFLAEVQRDAIIRNFLQLWVGYCLTGLVDEQKFLFLYGSGLNGKSVFIEIIAKLLGDYARKISTDMLMQHQRSPQAPDADFVALKGKRFVYANETEEGRRLSDARIKELTGGDTLIGRVPYAKEAVSFRPALKLVLAGNHRPEVSDTSYGMWRRVLLVLFGQTIPEAERDPQLISKLQEEMSGILNWALAGLRSYRSGGLTVPSAIKAATDAYRTDEDILGLFIEERCETGPEYAAEKDTLYLAFEGWLKANGHKQMSRKSFTRRLGDRTYRLSPDRRKIRGLKLVDIRRAGMPV